jgi:hypothetical protein
MKTIHKYVLNHVYSGGKTVITAPANAKFVNVANQNEELCVWAEVCTTNPLIHYEFQVYSTGEEIVNEADVERDFLGTVLFNRGAFVTHIYQLYK